ncbi:MAG: hypothetical protein WC418_01765 [Candidatus Omnitrophota bacterium]|jgi:hypothetical protein
MNKLVNNKILVSIVLFVFCVNSIPAGLYASAGRNDNLRPKSIGQTKDGGKNKTELSRDMRKKELPDGGLDTVSLLVELDYVMRMLKVSDYKRAIQIILTSSSSTGFINDLAGLSGESVETVEAAMDKIDIFKPLVADARYRRVKNFFPAEFANKGIDFDVAVDGFTQTGSQADVSGGAMSEYLQFMRGAASGVQNVFRDNQEQFLGRFLGMKVEKSGETSDLQDIINKLDAYLDGDERAALKGMQKRFPDLKYIITSGIGANEMYSHLRARLFNEYMEKNGLPFRWIVVNNPAHERILPKDADNKNTIVFEMSRSGSTDETKKFMLYTLKRFKHRIVAANKGALNEIGRELSKDEQALVSIFDDIPEDIGGRQMNRKTLMLYAPLYLALRLGLQDKQAAVATLKEYCKASLDSNQRLSYRPGSLAVNGAEFLFRHRGSGRHNFAVVYSPGLYPLFKELEQLNNEGANKVTADGINNNLVIGYSMDNPDIYKLVFDKAGDSQIGIFFLNKNAADYQQNLRYIAGLRAKGVPVIAVALDINGGEALKGENLSTLQQNLMTAERASYLVQDMIVYFTYLTKQDANSNPNVKLVRAITATIFDALIAKKLNRDPNPVITFKEIAGSLAVKDAKDKTTLAETIDTVKNKEGKVIERIIRRTMEEIGSTDFNDFLQEAAALENALGMKEGAVGKVINTALSKKVAEADLGEAGGAAVPNINATFAKSDLEGAEQREQRLADESKEGLYKQLVLNPEDQNMSFAVALRENSSWSPEGRSIEQKVAKYIIDMWDGNIIYMPLSYMEVDINNPDISDIVRGILNRFAQWGITVPMLAYPNSAHTGAEGVFTHQKKALNIAIVYTRAYGDKIGGSVIEKGKSSDVKEWPITIDNATYVFGIGNVARGAFAGGRTLMVTVPDATYLPQIKKILDKAFDIAAENIKGRFYKGDVLPAGLRNIVKSFNSSITEEQLASRWKEFNNYNSAIYSQLSGEKLNEFIKSLIAKELLDTGSQKAAIFSEEDSKLPGFYPTLNALRALEGVKVTKGDKKGQSVFKMAVYGKDAGAIQALLNDPQLVIADDLVSLKAKLEKTGVKAADMIVVNAKGEQPVGRDIGLRSIVSGDVFTLAAGVALKELFASVDAGHKQAVDDAFGGVFVSFIETKIVPVSGEDLTATYHKVVTNPVTTENPLDLAALPTMEAGKHTAVTEAQVEVAKITTTLTGIGA